MWILSDFAGKGIKFCGQPFYFGGEEKGWHLYWIPIFKGRQPWRPPLLLLAWIYEAIVERGFMAAYLKSRLDGYLISSLLFFKWMHWEQLSYLLEENPSAEWECHISVLNREGDVIRLPASLPFPINTTGAYLITVIDCQVSEWSEWSKCNVACGKGTSTRTRQVLRPESNGGLQCPHLEEKQACKASRCSKRRLDKVSAHRGKSRSFLVDLTDKLDFFSASFQKLPCFCQGSMLQLQLDQKITTSGPISDPIRQKKVRRIVLSLELTKPWSLVDTRRTLMILAMVSFLQKRLHYIRVILINHLDFFFTLQAIQSVYNVTTKLKEVTSEVVVKVTERKANAPVSRTFWHLVAMANGLGWKSPRIVNHAKMVRISFLSSSPTFPFWCHTNFRSDDN